MEIVIIILLIILILLLSISLFLRFFDKKNEKIIDFEPKPNKLTREEKEKRERLKKSFDNLMNYDEKTARRRK